MFSSLPSASKIYVSSAKSRQKSASSAKKKRRKVQPNPNFESNTDETLISLANNENEPNNEISSRNSDLQSDFATSSHCYWEREDSSSEFSLPTVKIGNRRRSHASDGKIKDDAIDENSVKTSVIRRRSLAIEEKLETRVNEKPAETGVDRLRLPSVDVTLKEIDIDEGQDETGILLQRRDSLGSPSQETNGIMEDSEISNVEELSMEPTQTSPSDMPETVLSCSADNEAESENVNIKTDELDDVKHLQEGLDLDEVNHNGTAPAESKFIKDTEGETSEIPLRDEIIDEPENHNSEDFNDNSIPDSSSHSSINIENDSRKESLSEIHELDGDLHAPTNCDESILPISTDLCSDVNAVENCTNDHLHSTEESNLTEGESLSDNLLIAERIQSPEQSELSCTESMMNESRSICPEVQPSVNSLLNESKISVDYSNHAVVIEENCYGKDHSNVCQSFSDLGKASFSVGSLKRSTSWPASLHVLEKHSKFQKESVSKGPSFSDKATFTVDLFYDKESSSSDALADDEKSEENIPEIGKESKSVSVTFKEVVSQNILPPLAMLQARSRSYVFGSMGPKGSLLGNDELSRFFPDNQVSIFVGTWNMNSQDPPKSIDDFLLPLDIITLPDIYAIGVQESMQSRSEWEVLLQTTLGPSHVLFTSSSLGVLHLSIFLRRDLIWFCSEPEEASVTTRPGSMVKTKGAVAICFMFFGTSLLFVNSHLTAHEQKLKERLSDYEKICSALDLPKLIPLKSHNRNKDVTSRFDCVFWCGDLNFRVIRDRPSVLSFVDQKIRKPRPSCSFLIKHDQLHKAMAEGIAFHGFKEGVINFIPSYKFDVGTSTFDSAKLRVPSYTDRILYRCKEKSSISCLHYNAASDILTSDHKPVFAVFNVSLKPGRDNVPLAGGMFKRDIYLEAIKRRAKFLEVRHNHGQSAICNVM